MSRLTFDRVFVDGFGLHRAEFDVGCHTVVCDTALGGRTLVALAAGELFPVRGRVLVDEGPPASRPRLRRRIGALTAEPSMPDGATVRDVLRTIGELRRQAIDWSMELANWGIGLWLDRRVAALAEDERRAVALVAALGTRCPLAIVLHEPFVGVAALDVEQVCSRLLAVSEAAVVVVTVTEPRDAQRLAGSKWLLRPGRVEALDPALLTPERSGGSVSMRVRCEQPRDLVAELALRREVLAIAFSAASGDPSIWIRGLDARALSAALLQAAHETGAALSSWEIVPTPLAVVVAAHDGSVRGAYERAWYAAQAPRGFWGGNTPNRDYAPPSMADFPAPAHPPGVMASSAFAPSQVDSALGARRSVPVEPSEQVAPTDATSQSAGAALSEAVEPPTLDRERGNTPNRGGAP